MTNVENKMYKVEVKKVSGLNASTRAIRFGFVNKKESKNFGFVPGQFIMVSVLGYGEAALTITTAPEELPEFEVAVRTTGVATQALNRLRVGDVAYIRGPLGNAILTDKIYGKKIILIAGGIGLAPLRSLIHTLRDDQEIASQTTIVYGAKTPEDLIFKSELSSFTKFAEAFITVDKADRLWTGEVGNIVDCLKKLKLDKESTAIVCGPPVMYKAVAKVLLDKGLSEENIEFMLERRIKCGIGKCQHCTCGGKYVCTDGPTFTYKDLKDNPEAFK